MVCEEEYELLEQIGRGSYGKVYRAQHESGEVHAIKVVELDAADDDLDSIQQEIKMLQAFNCPQLTRYYGSFIVGSALWISMEYLEGGSLQDLMKTSKSNLDEHTTQWILREMLKALVYLHSERKIHRDVKAGNILVASDGSVRLADFGESVQLTHSIAKRQTFAGSPYWMAPEVIMAQDTYNSKADIWSLGVTAIEMIKGRPPYSEMHPMKAVLCIPNNPPPTLGKDGHFNKHFHTFLEQCFHRDPNLRPSAQDLLKHPFMKAAKPTDALKKLLEARRAAEMMKSLFGGGLLDSMPAPPSDATHKATKTTTLPASAAAAIAAAQAASTGSHNAPGATTLDPKMASVEWDFGDGDDDFPEKANPAAAAAAPGPAALDCSSPTQAGGFQREGSGGGWVSPDGVSAPPSPGAVTPQARGGSGAMWADALAEEEGRRGDRKGLREPPPLAERQRRRGKTSKAGHVSGIDDAASAATLQEQMTTLSRQQDEELTRRRKARDLGPSTSLRPRAATENAPQVTNTSGGGGGGGGGGTFATAAAKVTSSLDLSNPPTPSAVSFFEEQRQRQRDQQQPREQRQDPRTALFGGSDGGGGGGGGGGRGSRHASSPLQAGALTPPSSTIPAAGSPMLAATPPSSSREAAAAASTPTSGGGLGAGGDGSLMEARRSGAMFEKLLRGRSLDSNSSSVCSASSAGGERQNTVRSRTRAVAVGRAELEARGGGKDGGRRSDRGVAVKSGAGRGKALGKKKGDSAATAHKARKDAGGRGSLATERNTTAAAAASADDGTKVEPEAAPTLVTRMSWEQDDVGDLVDFGLAAASGSTLSPAAIGAGGPSEAKAGGDKGGGFSDGNGGVARKAGSGEVLELGPRRDESGKGGEAEGVLGAVGEQGGAEGGKGKEGAPQIDDLRGKSGGLGDEGVEQPSLPSSLSTAATTMTPITVRIPVAPALAAGRARDSGSAEKEESRVTAQPSSLSTSCGSCGSKDGDEKPGHGSSDRRERVAESEESQATGETGEGGDFTDGVDCTGDGSELREAEVGKSDGRGGQSAADAGVADTARMGVRDGSSEMVKSSIEAAEGEESQPKVPAAGWSESDSGVAPLIASGSAAAAPGVARPEEGGDGEEGDGGATVAASEAAVAAVDGVEEEDRLTATFHAHLTPALCELWDATEDGSARRQAVQDLAMALERLDGCSNGELTLDFVSAVAKSWPSGQQASGEPEAIPPSPE